jgi:hypothetical protein
MTTRPELRDLSGLTPALAALGLFVVMAAVFVGAPLGANEGFPDETANVTLGNASVADSATIEHKEDKATFANVSTADGEELTKLTDEDEVSASIVTAGDETHGVVSVSITESIGYAMFGLTEHIPSEYRSESFLAVFEIIDLVLVAALVGAVMLARREDAGEIVTLFTTSEDAPTPDALAADGGGRTDAASTEPASDDEGGDA